VGVNRGPFEETGEERRCQGEGGRRLQLESGGNDGVMVKLKERVPGEGVKK